MKLSIDVGYKTMAICKLDSNRHISRWEVIDLSRNSAGNTKGDIVDACLIWLMDDTELLEKTEQVVIETQPRFNPTMMRLSHTVAAYVQLWALQTGSAIEVSFCPASRKNAYLCRALGLKRTSTYSENKKRSVTYVSSALPDEWKKYFESHKKKDDLADCFVQAIL
jgi:hypothetical protein